jgi:hypothetical protein
MHRALSIQQTGMEVSRFLFEVQHTTHNQLRRKDMQTLKRLALVAGLTVAFSVTIFADDPCSSVPGQTNTPPCASAPLTSDDAPTLSEAPVPSNDSQDLSITELAIDVLSTVLALF